MKTWFTITNKATDAAAVIDIFDEIGLWGVTTKDFAEALKGVAEDRDITVRINSPGGEIWDGFAIFHLLRARKDHVTCHVIGLAASMASIIMLAGKRTIAAENATIMIHNPTAITWGEADDMREMADLLDKLKGQLVAVYAAKSGKKEDEVTAAMDAVTWLTGPEAKEWGLVDEISESLKIAACHDLSRFGKLPANISGGAKPTSTNNQPEKVSMKNLLKALVEAKLIASADVSEDTAVAQFSANFASIQSNADATATENTELKQKVAEQEKQAKADLHARAESAIAAAVKAGRLKDEAPLRAKWIEAYERDEEGAKAMLDALPEPKAQRGVAPVATTPANPEEKPKLTGLALAIAAQKAKLAAAENPKAK